MGLWEHLLQAQLRFGAATVIGKLGHRLEL
jgi:hypothetical protein